LDSDDDDDDYDNKPVWSTWAVGALSGVQYVLTSTSDAISHINYKAIKLSFTSHGMDNPRQLALQRRRSESINGEITGF
jgi:hypothetical protein